jgi:probable HAF family extracellular repeat protein
MSVSIVRTAVAGAIVCLSFTGAAVAAPQYKLVLIDGTSAVADVANRGWSVSSVTNAHSDQRCQRQVCAPVPSLPNDLGLVDTQANAVNNLGHVAGQSAAGDGTVRHAFMFDGTQTIDLGVFDNDGCGGCTLTSAATALNDKGQVAGTGTVGDGWHRQAFLWQDGVLKGLGTLGGLDSSALGINRKGHVVGSSQRADGYTHAFIYRNGKMRDLGTVEGDIYSDASGINDAGQIVGSSSPGGGKYRAYIQNDGVKTRLPMVPGAEWSVATDINNQGWVVGVSFVSTSLQGWVYDGQDTYNLNKVLTNFDPRYVVQGGRGIADNGQIAVEVIDNQTHRVVGAVLVPVN